MSNLNDYHHILVYVSGRTQAANRLRSARAELRLLGLSDEQVAEVQEKAIDLSSRTVEDSSTVFWRVMGSVKSQLASGVALDLQKISKEESDRADIQALSFGSLTSDERSPRHGLPDLP